MWPKDFSVGCKVGSAGAQAMIEYDDNIAIVLYILCIVFYNELREVSQ